MSDFLGRLAARVLGVEPSLRPRVASRFEPASAAGGQEGDGLQAREPARSSQGPVQVARRRSLPPPGLTPDPSPIAPPSDRERGAPAQEPSPPAPLPRERGEKQGKASLPPLPVEGGAMGEGGRGGEVGRGKAPDIQEVPWRAQPSRLGPGVSSQAAPTTMILKESSRSSGEPLPSQGRVLPAAGRAVPEPGKSLPEAREGLSGARETPSQALPVTRSAEELPIRVTIGRIEVRAAAPAPPPAPRPAAGPRMSLEDYLHRRGEGRL